MATNPPTLGLPGRTGGPGLPPPALGLVPKTGGIKPSKGTVLGGTGGPGFKATTGRGLGGPPLLLSSGPRASPPASPPAGSGQMINGKWYGNAYLAQNPGLLQGGGTGQPTPTGGPTTSLVNQSNPDPRLTSVVDNNIKSLTDRQKQLLGTENQQDPNLQFQIDKYKERLSNDPTTRAINRVGSAVRGQSALQQKQANQQAAFSGGDVGSQGAAIASGAGNRLAKASADIALGRERDLDQLTIAGQGIMSAPGQMQFARQNATNSFMLGGAGSMLNSAQAPSQLALQQGQLGLQQWQAQNNAQNQNSQLAMQQQQMQAQMAQQQMQAYMQMLSMMYK